MTVRLRMYFATTAYCADCVWRSAPFTGPNSEDLAYTQWLIHKESGACKSPEFESEEEEDAHPAKH